MAKTAWGIELGTSSVKAVKLGGDRGGVSLEDVAIISLAEFGLGAGTTIQDATAGALNELRSSKGIKKGEEVFVSISGQNTLGRIISLPPVPKERVRETIENEARSQIPIKLEDAVWDFQIIDDQDPDELRVNLYAAKKDVVDELVDICDMAGLQITGVQVAPLGIYNYIKYEMDDAVSDSCVAIDIGAENTDVIILDGQKTYVRVVPVAGNDITKALRARFKLAADDAEKLKRRAHKSKDAAAVFEAMKPPLKDMVGEIYRAVGFYKSQHDDANINQLVMMGNGSKLLNIKKFFEQQLQYQVHKVDTPVRIALARSVDPTEVQNNIQSLTVAIGLSLQGLGLDEVNTINLIPPEYIERQGVAKMQVPFYAGGAIAAVGGLIALLMAIFSTAGVDTVIEQAGSLASTADKRNKEVSALQPAQEDVEKAYSLMNVASGVVGSLPAAKPSDEDDEDAPPPQDTELTMRADEAGALISRTTIDALAKYAGGDPRTKIYYANFTVQGLNGGLLQRTASLLEAKEEPAWVGAEEGEGGHYTNKRTYTFRVWVASRLTSSIDENAAHEALSGKLGDKKKGMLVEQLRAALIEELRATGQLKDLDEKALAKINFDDHLTIAINQISNTQYTNKGKITLAEIVGTNVGMTVNGRPPKASRELNEAEFGVSEISVTLTLTPVQAPSSGEEEEATE
ncbi:MAG: type IV pilus assembly protein PilM [Planctomycetes bacterium]|nr:type IV pilus assembly protein PilM [Planctomycetota bacterium]MCA8934837.1 type IV pilus assembly protein PilM [Planctomycetota bacterium]